jgi:hypothetical protein
MIWIVEGEGFAVRNLGRLFAASCEKNLDRAIPLLTDELARLVAIGFSDMQARSELLPNLPPEIQRSIKRKAQRRHQSLRRSRGNFCAKLGCSG